MRECEIEFIDKMRHRNMLKFLCSESVYRLLLRFENDGNGAVHDDDG